MTAASVPAPGVERLRADERRESLMDITRDIVVERGPHAVTVGAVADRAEVTRALVYKHFDNKDDLLLAVYRREAKRLDKQIRRIVEAADDGFESKVRAFIVAAIEAVDDHGPFFMPLRDARADPSVRRDRRGWDARSVTYFADLAVAEFRIDTESARAAMSVLLAGVPAVLSRARSRERRVELEQLYVDTVLGALSRIAGR